MSHLCLTFTRRGCAVPIQQMRELRLSSLCNMMLSSFFAFGVILPMQMQKGCLGIFPNQSKGAYITLVSLPEWQRKGSCCQTSLSCSVDHPLAALPQCSLPRSTPPPAQVKPISNSPLHVFCLNGRRQGLENGAHVLLALGTG